MRVLIKWLKMKMLITNMKNIQTRMKVKEERRSITIATKYNIKGSVIYYKT